MVDLLNVFNKMQEKKLKGLIFADAQKFEFSRVFNFTVDLRSAKFANFSTREIYYC